MEKIKGEQLKEQARLVKKAKKAKNKHQWTPFTIGSLVYLILFTIVLFFMIGWAFVKSIHEIRDFILTGAKMTTWPDKFSFKSYVEAFNVIEYTVPKRYDPNTRTVGLLGMVFNSLFYSIGSAFVRVTLVASMGYLTAKHNFWFNKVIVGIFFFEMLFPIIGAMSATVKVHTELGLFDTWIGVFVLKFNYLGGTTLLLYQRTFYSLDDGYREAAYIDGAGHFRVMYTICFPLIKPLLMMGLVTNFIGFWNDYQTALVYMPSHPTAAYGLYLYGSLKSEFAFMPYKLAGFMLLLLPCIIIFLVFKEKFLGNVSEGGIKG